MASKIKLNLAKTVFNVFRPQWTNTSFETIFKYFSKVEYDPQNGVFWVLNFPNTDANNLHPLLKNVEKKLIENTGVNGTHLNKVNDECRFNIKLDTEQFVKDILESDPISLNFEPTRKKVIVEYSSPNIAKPFHVGHLRSTIIGNSIANLKKKLGNNVFKLNYIGDWGTQFGIIQLGVEHQKYTIDDIKKDPINLLFQAYVKGNELTKNHQDAYEKAKKNFYLLEQEDKKLIELWNKYRTWTIEELNTTYKRLGVEFDSFSWESDYRRNVADNVLKLLEEKGILSTDEFQKKVATIDDKVVPLIKSDNTTLYILRDLMAVIDRISTHNFDEMYYVVDNGQAEHFTNLFKICEKLELNKNKILHQIKFGKIKGMKTRKGNVIFLNDVIDEASERVLAKQKSTKTTKTSPDDKETADVLGVSAVIINDLKRSRTKDYNAIWEDMLQMNSDTGVFLQYCHCRLSNLSLECGKTCASNCDPQALKEIEAINLIKHIANYESILLKANETLQPKELVLYLFALCRAANGALKKLNIKSADDHTGSQRLLLFEKTRLVLEDGMKLLGLKPLRKM